MSSKIFVKVCFGALLAAIVGCGSSTPAAPAPTACSSLETQCNACGDATMKQACLTLLLQYKSGGATGESACKSVIDQDTYGGSSNCVDQCALLKPVCATCKDGAMGMFATMCNNTLATGMCTGAV